MGRIATLNFVRNLSLSKVKMSRYDGAIVRVSDSDLACSRVSW